MTITVERKTADGRSFIVPEAQKKVHPYYDFGPCLSRNGTYNYIVGGRGLGKTYGALKIGIRNFIRRGEQFIYLRRFTDEIKAVRNTFFDAIMHEFPEWEFRVNGIKLEIAPISTKDDKKRPWKIMGFLIVLATAQQVKSVVFNNVKLIIFDEFIIEVGVNHYLPNEADVFDGFYSTVDRWQDKTRVFFLANAVRMDNPYFNEHEIEPSGNDEMIVLKDGFIVAHFPNSADFVSSVSTTKFGQFIKGREYEKYAIANQFSDNRSELVRPKDPRAIHRFNLETHKGWVSIWHNRLTAIYYVSKQIPPGQLEYTLIPGRNSKDKLLLLHTDDVMNQFRAAYRAGQVEFDRPATENVFMDIFNKKK